MIEKYEKNKFNIYEEVLDIKSIPEFIEPENITIETYQGDRPAILKDDTPIKTTGCNLCSALILKKENLSILFHIENSGLTLRQEKSIMDLPKGDYIGKAIGNKKGNVSGDTIEVLRKKGGICASIIKEKITTEGWTYDILYRPKENKIYIKIKNKKNPKIFRMEGL